jgi:hypothetical protein
VYCFLVSCFLVSGYRCLDVPLFKDLQECSRLQGKKKTLSSSKLEEANVILKHMEHTSYFSTLLHMHAFNLNPMLFTFPYHSLLP